MEREINVNCFDGVITKRNTVAFADGEFECDMSGILEQYAEEGTAVKAYIHFNDIKMSDDKDAGSVCGNITSLIYKGDHYNYTVKTKNGFEYILNDEFLWNENDYVSLIIPKEAIKIEPLSGEV